MRNQPHVKQRDISEKLGITIQAISKYFKKLTKEGLLEVGAERVDYRLTSKAIIKLHENTRALESYVTEVKRDLKIEHAWPAIATAPLKAGQEVGLTLKEGVLYTEALDSPNAEATGIALADAEPGEDLGLERTAWKTQNETG